MSPQDEQRDIDKPAAWYSDTSLPSSFRNGWTTVMLTVGNGSRNIWRPRWSDLGDDELDRICAAGKEVQFWTGVLQKTGGHPLSEILRGVDEIDYDRYYPDANIYDSETGCQYFFHAHADRPEEFGHFHTYIMRDAIPDGMRAYYPAPTGKHDDPFVTHCHLVAVAMQRDGTPSELFTINHWAAQDAVYSAGQLMRLLDQFEIGHSEPSWPANRWLTNLLRLFRPQLRQLFRHKVNRLELARMADPDSHPQSDEDLEVVSSMTISIERQLLEGTREIERRQRLGNFAPNQLETAQVLLG